MKHKKRALFLIGILIFLVVLPGLGLLTTRGSELFLRALIAWKMPACRISWKSADGNLFEQLTLRDVEIHSVPGVPSRPRALIQKIDIYFVSLRPEGLNIEFYRGRYFSKGSEPLVFHGIYQDRALDAELFLSSGGLAPELILLDFDFRVERSENGIRLLGKTHGIAFRISLK